jgi:rRNA processing protein Krr1/Pno1
LIELSRSIIEHSFVLARKQQTSASSSSNSSTSSGSNTNLHYNSLIYPASTSNLQQITIQVRVPYRVVGLVVGPKGATIKRIQQNTNTYIVTPGRDKEPVFEIAGLPENVEAAKAEIESHIAARTGQLSDNESGVMEENDFDKDLFSLTETIDSNQHCSKWIQLNNTSSNPTTTTKFSHHLSLPFPQEEKIKAATYRSISQSSFFPLNDQQFDFNTSFEQISDDNLETVWPNFNFISMKTSMGFA